MEFFTENNYCVRLSNMDDLDSILNTYSSARIRMRESGNPNQWKDDRPSKDMVLNDIKNNTGYVIIDQESKKICGVFALVFGDDPTYSYIENGEWLNNEPYATIHRIASDGIHHNILKTALDYALSKIDNVRVDTHYDNVIMQKAISKLGFIKCGQIYVEDGSPRIAYQLCT